MIWLGKINYKNSTASILLNIANGRWVRINTMGEALSRCSNRFIIDNFQNLIFTLKYFLSTWHHSQSALPINLNYYRDKQGDKYWIKQQQINHKNCYFSCSKLFPTQMGPQDQKPNWKIQLRLNTFNLTGKWHFYRTHDFVFNEAYEVDIISFKSNIISTYTFDVFAHPRTSKNDKINNLTPKIQRFATRFPLTWYKYDT